MKDIKSTIRTTEGYNIGQVRIEDAQKEIDRLNNQETNSGLYWTTDYSDILIEDNMFEYNEYELCDGYAWIVAKIKE